MEHTTAINVQKILVHSSLSAALAASLVLLALLVELIGIGSLLLRTENTLYLFALAVKPIVLFSLLGAAISVWFQVSRT